MEPNPKPNDVGGPGGAMPPEPPGGQNSPAPGANAAGAAPTGSAPGSAEATPQSVVDLDVKDLRSQQTNIAGTINITLERAYNDVVRHYLPEGSSIATRFVLDSNWQIKEEYQTEIGRRFVGDAVEIEQLQKVLAKKRVLLLSGEVGLGRTTTAIYLAHLMMTTAESGNCARALNSKKSKTRLRQTYLIPALDRQTRVDFDEIHKDGKGPANRFVVFENAFLRNNQYLLRFFKDLNEPRLAQFSDKLARSNCYLVFTFTTTEASQLQSEPALKELHYELKYPSEELLSKSLDQMLDSLLTEPRINASHLAVLGDLKQRKVLLQQIKTIPGVVGFVGDYLRDFSTEGEVDLSEAIRRSEDIRYWFQQDLTSDWDSWCFALSLALAHCRADAGGVSWYNFECLRGAVWLVLKRNPELFPPKSFSNEQIFGDAPAKVPILTDDVFLDRCRAKIQKDPNSLSDVISFCDEGRAQKLWRTLLKHNRRVLAMLLARFAEMVEDQATEPEPRALCAQIIGRFGEIDPERITSFLIDRWVYSSEIYQQASVGALYQGIIASEDEHYRGYFLERLEELGTPSEIDEDAEPNDPVDPAEKKRLLTVIAICSRIGVQELSLAMKCLRRIVETKLVRAMRQAQLVERYIDRTNQAFAKELSAEGALDLLIYQKFLSDFAGRLYNQQSSIFVGVQYTLCYLALTTNVITVFQTLRRWIETSNRETGALIALMFLFEDGIAATLRSEGGNQSNSSERRGCSPIVETMVSEGDSAVLEMARFLATLYESFDVTFAYPSQFIRYLKASFLFQLTEWVDEALPIESCRIAMEKLFQELLRIHQGSLFDLTHDLLNSAKFLEAPGRKAFANAVLWSVH
jgi:hypothetical protein